jgi:Condensation domain
MARLRTDEEGRMPEVKSADLCWGQRHQWLHYLHAPEGTRHDAHIVVSRALPDGTSVGDVRATLNYLARRHEVLRTVYDANARPWPRQRVQPPGAVPLVVATTEQDGTPAAADAVHELSTTEFDLERDWPIRAGVVTTGGAARRLVVVFNHVGFDDWGLEVFRREFEAVLTAATARRRAVLLPVAWQPVDLARNEAARTEAETGRAIGHWREQLALAPADILARRRAALGPARTEGPEAYNASLVSPGLLAASRDIAARCQVWPSAVHLAAYAVGMAAYTGEQVITPRWLVSHRDGGENISVMTCMFAPTLVPVDLSGDPGFGEVVRRTAAASALAQEHAYAAYDEIVELTALEGFRRGRPVAEGSTMNFLTHITRSCGSRRERLTWNAEPVEWVRGGADTYVRVYEWSDGVSVALQASARVMSQEDVEAFLRGYSRLLAAHQDPDTDMTVSQAMALFGYSSLPEGRVLRVGPDAVDADACEALLMSHPAVRAARVAVEERGLVADVEIDADADAAPAGGVTPALLRAFVLAAVEENPSAACPAWFRVTGSPGAPLLEGDGHEPATAEPGDDPAAPTARRALAAAVARVNELERVDLALCYTAAGGRVLRMPRVVDELRDAGWSGVSMDGLCGVRPLAALADAMSRTVS